MPKKAQIVMEFFAIVAIGLIMAILFASLIGYQITGISDDNEFKAINDLGVSTKNELDSAVTVLPGYERNFTLPDDLQGIPYNISNIQTSLIVSTGNKELVFKIPAVTGTIKKGSNIIRNENGAVYLN